MTKTVSYVHFVPIALSESGKRREKYMMRKTQYKKNEVEFRPIVL